MLCLPATDAAARAAAHAERQEPQAGGLPRAVGGAAAGVPRRRLSACRCRPGWPRCQSCRRASAWGAPGCAYRAGHARIPPAARPFCYRFIALNAIHAARTDVAHASSCVCLCSHRSRAHIGVRQISQVPDAKLLANVHCRPAHVNAAQATSQRAVQTSAGKRRARTEPVAGEALPLIARPGRRRRRAAREQVEHAKGAPTPAKSRRNWGVRGVPAATCRRHRAWYERRTVAEARALPARRS